MALLNILLGGGGGGVVVVELSLVGVEAFPFSEMEVSAICFHLSAAAAAE